MPTYVYQCESNAEHVFSEFMAIDRRDGEQQCPQCRSVAWRKIVQDVSVQYKGNDWSRKEDRSF